MKKRIIITFTIITFIFSIIFMGANTLCNSSAYAVLENAYEQVIDVVHGELLNDVLCVSGTYEQILSTRAGFTDDARNQIEEKINRYFDSMVANTDSYLDWYYSFSGQASQLFSIVKGVFSGKVEESIENKIREKLTVTLNPGFDLNADINSIVEKTNVLIEKATDEIIAANAIPEDLNANYVITLDLTLNEIAQTAAINAEIDPAVRNTVGIVGGIVSGTIVKRVVKNVMSRAISKLAISSISKIAVPTTAGTAVGGVVGGLVGFVSGIGFDYLVTKVDEAFTRENYKAEILNCIEQERMEVLGVVDEIIAHVNV